MNILHYVFILGSDKGIDAAKRVTITEGRRVRVSENLP